MFITNVEKLFQYATDYVKKMLLINTSNARYILIFANDTVKNTK